MAKRLLIVDDEPTLVRALERYLRAEGFDITTARSGSDALVKIALSGRARADGNSFHDERLTETENRIAASVARGLTNKEIAAEMEISVRTVENHVSHILDKKHFHNRVEIARYVMERGT